MKYQNKLSTLIHEALLDINQTVKKQTTVEIGWFYLKAESHHIDNLKLEYDGDIVNVTYTWKGQFRKFILHDLMSYFTALDIMRLGDKIIKC